MPRETHTIVFGTYGAPLGSSLVLEGEDHKVRRIVVRIPKKDVPVFVVVTAYDPVEWELIPDLGAEIAGLLAMGYHNQVVRNLPEHVPFGFSTYKSGPGTECPKAVYAYGKGAQLDELRKLLNLEFSLSIDEFYPANGAECLYKGCQLSQPVRPGFWQSLFGGSAATNPAGPPPPPLRASARVVHDGRATR